MTHTLSTTTPAPVQSKLFSVLTGLTSLVVLLQGLWAGIFLEHDGARDDAAGWIDLHARGGELAIAMAVVSLTFVLVKLRSRLDLLVGSAMLAVLLMTESYLGGLIRDDSQDTLTAVHVPLAMAIMGLAVWLPLRARRR